MVDSYIFRALIANFVNFTGRVFQHSHLSPISPLISDQTNFCSCCCHFSDILFPQSRMDSLNNQTVAPFKFVILFIEWKFDG